MDNVQRASPVVLAQVLAPLIAGEADAIEHGRRLTQPILGALHSARLFRMFYPRSVGGDEIEPSQYVLAVEELARADGSVGWCASIANSIGLFAPYLELDAARRVFGDPRATCAWGPPNDARGIAVPGGYRVTGRWDFASGCRHASWIGAHGTVVEPDGTLRLNNFGRPTIRTWLFPAEEVTLLDNWNPIGLRGTASESYTVEDLFVPEELTGTREDPTLRRDPGKLYAFPQQTLYSVGIASVALGIARGMLEAFIELARRKTPRGTGRLADNAVIQAEIARAEARLGAARAYLVGTVHDIYQHADDIAPIEVPERARARLAGSHAVSSAVGVADWAYKAAGVDAIFPGSPFERRFRDIHTVSQQIQSRDAHYETVGQVLLGQPPEVFL
ncbi:MAG TPA: acyl-CoA dehydrogenase family protein [Stellaceae bacterium]|jgi:alkylation response protein AidB-like acyl-CoA dehydrogenase|nr:acyl-CoA dehydrogenase family protein [Stellaceae bacterium]